MTPRAVERNEWLHRWVWVLFDAAIWFAAIYGATWLRFDFKYAPVFVATTLLFAVAAVAGHFLVGAFIGPMYVDGLADVPGVRFLGRDEGRGDDEDNCWLTCIELDPAVTEVSPSKLIAELAGEDIESRRLRKPMHLQPVFASHRTFVNGESERLFDRGVTLPSGSALQDDEIERVIKVLHRALAVGL